MSPDRKLLDRRASAMATLMRSSNPALNEKAFKGQVTFGEAMTLQGTVNKTGFLLLCVATTAAWTWGLSHSPAPEAAVPWMIGGIFGGFIVALVTIFKQNWAPLTAPIYALLEGLALGASPPCLSARTRALRCKPSGSHSARFS